MSKFLNRFIDKGLINPPSFISDNIQYLCMTGSRAYGTNNEESDFDISGVVIPNKELIFPHLNGEIIGFGKQKKRFDFWEKSHIINSENKKEYDFQIYSIVRFFHLLLMNNPNILGILFVPYNCILEITQVGELIRENRKLFLHKGAWFRYKGYSFSQIHKLKSMNRTGRRAEIVNKFGYDLDFAYNCIRLLNEIEQILIEGDLDLQRNREQLKAIRRGDWTLEQILNYFNEKEKHLEQLYVESKLPYKPDEKKIKELLLNCLEHHYGNLSSCIMVQDRYVEGLKDIREILDKLGVY